MALKRVDAASFFWATLLLWLGFIAHQIAVDRRTEISTVAAGVAFFQAANFAVRYAVSGDPLFVNTAVSFLHSSIISLTVLLILVNQWMVNGLSKMLEHKELFGGTWLGAYSALCFSCGYFAYDQFDMLRYRLYGGQFPSILAHHLVLLLCFTLALHRRVTINYLILTLVCELHSIFLHMRKLRRMAGVRDAKSGLVRVEWVLNWASFLTARFIFHLFITYKLIVDASKFGEGIELPLALFGMVGMNMLNVSLGFDLFKAYRKEKIQ